MATQMVTIDQTIPCSHWLLQWYPSSRFILLFHTLIVTSMYTIYFFSTCKSSVSHQISKEGHLSLSMICGLVAHISSCIKSMYSHAGVVVYMSFLSGYFHRCSLWRQTMGRARRYRGFRKLTLDDLKNNLDNKKQEKYFYASILPHTNMLQGKSFILCDSYKASFVIEIKHLYEVGLNY